ncbi:MAG: MFS transporter [Methanosarcinales archaeon]|nr:MFS transporter [Methanosarcinales archaeon]
MTENQSKLYRDPNLQIVFVVTLIVVMGVSSISPAFPEIQEAFGISKPAVGLLIVVFTLPGVLFTPVLGVLADRFGRKKILVPSLLLFGIAGTACFFARDFNLLLTLRFLQGIGAASLGSLNVTIIGDLYSKRQLATAMGYNASVLNIAVPLYLIIGGAMASLAWYYPFALSIIAVPVGILVLTSLKSPEPKNQQDFKQYLSSAFQSIKNKQVLGLFSLTLFTFVILFGTYLTYFSLLLGGERFHASPLLIGVITSSMGLTTAATSSQLGTLTKRFSEKTLIKVAFVIYAVTLFVIPFVHTIWLFLVPTGIFGIAHGVNLPSIQTLLAKLAPIEYRAAFMSLNGMVLRLGQTLGPLVMGAIFLVGGFEGTFFVSAGLSVAMFILASVMLK